MTLRCIRVVDPDVLQAWLIVVRITDRARHTDECDGAVAEFIAAHTLDENMAGLQADGDAGKTAASGASAGAAFV